MDDKQHNNSNCHFNTDTAQNKTYKPQLTKFNAQHTPTSQFTPPTFQPEKTKSSNIILSNEKQKNKKE